MKQSISQSDPARAQALEAARAELFQGLVSVDELAAVTGRCTRTIRNWIDQGMPSVTVGHAPHVRLAEAKAWLVRDRRPHPATPPPKLRGRPRKLGSKA